MLSRSGFGVIVIVIAACGKPAQSIRVPTAEPFVLVGQGWIRLEATVSGSSGSSTNRMMFDTGGGVSLLSKRLCDRVGCVRDGTFKGTRMSGQELTLPMARVHSIVLAGHRASNVRVAVLEGTEFLPAELEIEGSLALDLFREQPFTIDYAAKLFGLEDESSLAKRLASGESTKVRVENDATSTVLYLPLELLPGAKPLEMEVDTGSLSMILDDRFMESLAIDTAAPGIERVEGHDQTNHPYLRTYAHLPHAAKVVGTKDVTVPAGATVMFQRIVHDGLVGHQFLSAHTTTFDIAHGTMIFARTP